MTQQVLPTPQPDHRLIHPTRRISFSNNWNNKLRCRFFTTIRLHTLPAGSEREPYFVAGQYYQVSLRKEYLFKGLVHEVKLCRLEQLPAFTAALDTGYGLEGTKDILRRTYPDADWSSQQLAILLVENIEYSDLF